MFVYLSSSLEWSLESERWPWGDKTHKPFRTRKCCVLFSVWKVLNVLSLRATGTYEHTNIPTHTYSVAQRRVGSRATPCLTSSSQFHHSTSTFINVCTPTYSVQTSPVCHPPTSRVWHNDFPPSNFPFTLMNLPAIQSCHARRRVVPSPLPTDGHANSVSKV